MNEETVFYLEKAAQTIFSLEISNEIAIFFQIQINRI